MKIGEYKIKSEKINNALWNKKDKIRKLISRGGDSHMKGAGMLEV